MSQTPEFLRWALIRDCDLRAGADGRSPDRVDRQLRTVRLWAEARSEGRERRGVCFGPGVERPDARPESLTGFRAADVLDAYAIDERAPSECADCPAHLDRFLAPDGEGAARRSTVDRAGCFGLLDWTPLADGLFDAVDRAWAETAVETAAEGPADGSSAEFGDESDAASSGRFPFTTPVWYGLWIDSPIPAARLPRLESLLDRLLDRGPVWRAVFERLASAVRTARRSSLELAVEYGPAGRIEGREWIVEAHCRRCRAAKGPGGRKCVVCGLAAPPEPARRRLARGVRPYRPLSEFLGADELAVRLDDYRTWRGGAS